VVSNGIADHYRGPPCHAEDLLRSGDLVQYRVRPSRLPLRYHEKKGVTPPRHRRSIHDEMEHADAPRGRTTSPCGWLTRAAQRPSSAIPSSTSTLGFRRAAWWTSQAILAALEGGSCTILQAKFAGSTFHARRCIRARRRARGYYAPKAYTFTRNAASHKGKPRRSGAFLVNGENLPNHTDCWAR
jgi:hypothetical protein